MDRRGAVRLGVARQAGNGKVGRGEIWRGMAGVARKSKKGEASMTYKWKPSSRIGINAETAGAVMDSLEQRGALTAKNLLDESRPAEAPLHNEFEWDDIKAAEEYRLQQARHIINCLVRIGRKVADIHGIIGPYILAQCAASNRCP